jgi:hypothetical protein
MPKQKYSSKKELSDIIAARQKEIVGNKMLETILVDALVPMSGMDGKIRSIADDGTVTIEFSGPILSYLDLIKRKDLQAIVDSLDGIQ